MRFLKSSSYRTGFQVSLKFSLGQHSRDEQQIISLIDYLGCGNVYVEGKLVVFTVIKFSDLTDKVIPFFFFFFVRKKHLDFKNFLLELLPSPHFPTP